MNTDDYIFIIGANDMDIDVNENSLTEKFEVKMVRGGVMILSRNHIRRKHIVLPFIKSLIVENKFECYI